MVKMRQNQVAALPPSALFLETERLNLRPLGKEDLDLALALFADPLVVEHVCDVSTLDEIERRLPTEMRRGAGGRLGVWVAVRKDTQAKVGTGVLLPLPVETEDTDWSLLTEGAYPNCEIEVGYMLIPDAWGQGFATEICAGLLKFGFTKTELTEIKATTEPVHHVSQKVLMKCGMKHEGIRRAYATSCSGFGLTKADWRAMQDEA